MGVHSVEGGSIPHPPISIVGDEGFTEANGVGGGDGSVSDPYLIEDYHITATSGTAVSIRNTTEQYVIRNLTIEGDTYQRSTGISIINSIGGRVESVEVIHALYGIYLLRTKMMSISNNTILYALVGIDSEIERDNEFIGNTIRGASGNRLMDWGLSVFDGYGSKIEGNTVSEGDRYGIYIHGGVGQRLSNNSVRGIKGSCIKFYPETFDMGGIYDGQMKIRYCTVRDSPIGIDTYHCRIDIVGSHFDNISAYGIHVVGEPAAYLIENRFSLTANPIWLDNVHSARIDSNTIEQGSTPGITVRDSRAYIQDNRISNRTIGIAMIGSSGQMRYNALIGNAIGVSLTSSLFVNITSNRITDSIDTGALLSDSNNCSITLNLILDAVVGLELISTSDVEFASNNVTGSQSEAVRVTGGGRNTFHHNNMIRNNYQDASGTYLGPQALDSTAGDAWDDGSEGNYWSDYRLRYPDAKTTGRTWDTPYDLAGSGARKDRFPLAEPMDLFPPVADAGPDWTIDQNTTVILDGSASRDDSGIVRYTWSFVYMGTTITLDGRTTAFAFDMPGVYKVTLTVLDRERRSSKDDATVTVLDTQPPVVIPGDDVFAGMGEPFTLDGSASWDNVAIVSYEWTVDPDGLGLSRHGMATTLSIDEPGVYEGILRARDGAGNTGMAKLAIHVLDTEPPHAVAGEDITVDQGTVVTLDGRGSTDNVGIANWSWSFNHGGKEVVLLGAMPSFNFTEPGLYGVVLRVRDSGGSTDEDALLVRVHDTVPPVAEAGEDRSVDQHVETILSGGASRDNVGIVAYEWTFIDGGTSGSLNGSEVVLVLHEAGVHEVALRVVDTEGNTGSDSLTITVRDTTPPVALAGPDAATAQGTPFQFDGGGSWDNVGIADFEWVLSGHGSAITLGGRACTHSFDVPGEYRVVLVVVDLEGNRGIDEMLLTVLDTDPPRAIAGTDRVVIEGAETVLDGTGSEDNVAIAGYRWTFEPASGMHDLSGPIQILSFNRTGEFYVTLEVHDSAGNVASDTMRVTVLPLRISWYVGPFAERSGDPVPGTTVHVLLNGTAFTGMTDKDGRLWLTIVRFDLVTPVEVSARKDGWRPLDFKIRLDSHGIALDPVPPMERETAVRAGPTMQIWSILLVLATVAAVVLARGLRHHRTRRAMRP